MQRVQKKHIIQDLNKKMVFLVGPRQAGKTWLAKDIGSQFPNTLYLNYDRIEDQSIIKNESWLKDTQLLILDELHKMPNWKNYLKGIYDTKPSHLKILVTGSARLDIYHQIGDSLAGRYFLHHLLPFSPAELHQLNQPVDIDRLLKRGGFPEPYLTNSDIDAQRWRMQYVDSLIRTDALELETIHDIRAIQTIFELLRTKVGSPISYASIAEDIGISPHTVKKYIHILEALYIVFKITPFSRNIARSLLKEPKLYFFDTGLVKGDKGSQLENLVAVSLLKHIYAKRDYAAEEYELKYLRTKEKKEIDFALICDNKIQQIIEVKYSDNSLSNALEAFSKKYQLSATQIVKDLKREQVHKEIPIQRVDHFLQALDL